MTSQYLHRDNATAAYSAAQSAPTSEMRAMYLAEAQYHATMAVFESNEQVLERVDSLTGLVAALD